jgi:carboxylesterase type B
MDVGRQDEDCLFLNVWSPDVSATANLPVMFWVHGGGYIFGSGNYPNYMPTSDQASAMGVVLVSLNYRLGPLGWLATRELSQESKTKSSGNYGYQDMTAALRWVKSNIKQFGGDPDTVTLFGQSAGGTATMALMAAPAAQGLFHRAWMLSGSARYNTTLAEAEQDNAYFLASAGCTEAEGMACLRAKPTSTLMDVVRWDTYPNWSGAGVGGFPNQSYTWGNLAIVDGHVIPKPPIEALSSLTTSTAHCSYCSSVPLIVASTGQETDIGPLDDVRPLSWAEYDALARERMAPFGKDAVAATLSLYPHEESVEFQYTSLSSDIGVNCPNDVIAAQIGPSWKANLVNLYRYVLTARPSSPMFMFQLPTTGREPTAVSQSDKIGDILTD